MENYAIYLRKSRIDTEAERAGQGETLARHRKALLDLAKARGYAITKIYEEVVSGETITSRPQMQALMHDVEQGIYTGVLVMEIERLARGDTIDQGLVAQTFKYSDTLIITPLKTYDPNNEFDEEFFEFGLFMSRREYKTINRRLQRGRDASAKEGKFLGSRAPYGYKRVQLHGQKGWTLEIVPEQAEVVRLIYDLYINGIDGRRLGVRLITIRLNELHIPAMSEKWEISTVRNILDNPVYAGKIRWKYIKTKKTGGEHKSSRCRSDDYILSEGLHEPIISPEMFEQVNQLRENRPVMPVGHKKEIRTPLAGLIKCKLCGRRLSFHISPSPKYPNYMLCSSPFCDNRGCKVDVLERRVLDGLRQWVTAYELNISHTEADTVQTAAIDTAISAKLSEIETMTKQNNKAFDLLEQGIYTPEIFAERTKTLSERISAAKKDIEQLTAEKDRVQQQNEMRADIIPHIKSVLQAYEAAPTPAAKNELLREVLDYTEYYKERSAVYRDVDDDDFELDLYPRLPERV